MSLSKQFARIMEGQRQALTLRIELCEVRKKQFENWVQKCQRVEAQEAAELIEKVCVGYYDSEIVALKYLQSNLDELQEYGCELVAKWEAEKEAKGE